MRPNARPSIALALASALAAPLLGSAGGAFAQTPAPVASTAPSAAADNSAKRKEDAKERFGKGLSLMTDEQWDNAYVEFSASIELYPTRVALKNAAVCLSQLGRFDEALDMYERLLKDFGTQLPPADLEAINKSIANLKTKVAYFTIKVNVDGAQILVDSRERGRSPLPAQVRVAGGTRVVRVVKEGYQPFDKKVPIASATTQTIDVNLEKLQGAGRLKVVEAAGKQAKVLVDGVEVGPTPYEGATAPGKHSVLLRGEGNLGTQPIEANVVLDQEIVLRLPLEELASEARIETAPAGATVVLDGVPLGQGTWEGRLRAGKHTVDASSEGYFRYSKAFDAPAGQKSVWRVSLDRDDNSTFWSKGRTRPFSVAILGGGLFGFSMGGSYENCGGTSYAAVATDSMLPIYSDIVTGNSIKCTDHQLPLGAFGGARLAYEIVPGLALELTGGYEYIRMQVSRQMNQLAEQQAPVFSDVTDFVSYKGVRVSGGLSYAIMRRPIELAFALHVGALISGIVNDTRNGTVHDIAYCPNDATTCAVKQTATPRPGQPGAPPTSDQTLQQGVGTFRSTLLIVEPEVRVSYPITDAFSIGIGVAGEVFIGGLQPGSGDSVQNLVDPVNPVNGRAYNWSPSGNHWATSGSLNAQGRESIAGTFVMPRASLFLKLSL
jgi:hypothetical protein